MSAFTISQMNQMIPTGAHDSAAAAAAAAAAQVVQADHANTSSLLAAQLQVNDENGKSNGKTNSRKPYTEEEVFGLIDLYAKYSSNGMNAKQRFNKNGQNKTLTTLIAEEMTMKFPNSLKIFDKENIRKKLDEIKQEYQVFRYLIYKSSGFGWNGTEGRFTIEYANLDLYKKEFVEMGGQLSAKADTFKKLMKPGNFYIYHYHELIGCNLHFDSEFDKVAASVFETNEASIRDHHRVQQGQGQQQQQHEQQGQHQAQQHQQQQRQNQVHSMSIEPELIQQSESLNHPQHQASKTSSPVSRHKKQQAPQQSSNIQQVQQQQVQQQQQQVVPPQSLTGAAVNVNHSHRGSKSNNGSISSNPGETNLFHGAGNNNRPTSITTTTPSANGSSRTGKNKNGGAQKRTYSNSISSSADSNHNNTTHNGSGLNSTTTTLDLSALGLTGGGNGGNGGVPSTTSSSPTTATSAAAAAAMTAAQIAEDDLLLEMTTRLCNDEPNTFKFSKVCELIENYRVVRKLLCSTHHEYEYKKKCLRQF